MLPGLTRSYYPEVKCCTYVHNETNQPNRVMWFVCLFVVRQWWFGNQRKSAGEWRRTWPQSATVINQWPKGGGVENAAGTQQDRRNGSTQGTI
jgi:hypothetical protein